MCAMKINGIPTRSLWPLEGQNAICIIDQTVLPHRFNTRDLTCLEDAANAIRTMQVRGAPLIGVTAAYGVALALPNGGEDTVLMNAINILGATRPTAVNLKWALERMHRHLAPLRPAERASAAWKEAAAIAEEDVTQNQSIGAHGLKLLTPLAVKNRRINLMTHCNAGWLATVDYGTALSPIYAAFDAGVDVHVWVSETRPRNQGLLTAWELAQHGVPHTVIADNAAGLLLMRGQVDAVIVGADRIAANGDVANKIGTYLKALAAHEAGVPFFVAAPSTTFDFGCNSGAAIAIEERDGDELRIVFGCDADKNPSSVRQLLAAEAVANPAFDITPARFVSAIISERGTCSASSLRTLYPEIDHVQA